MIQQHILEISGKIDMESVFKLLPKKDAVRFSLFCVKDCAQFSTAESAPLVKHCIKLTEQWLKCPESVTPEELNDAADEADITNLDWSGNLQDDFFAACRACTAARHMCHSITKPHTYSIVSNIAYSVPFAFYTRKSCRKIKTNEYKSYAISLLRTTTIDKSKLHIKGEITDKITLIALLDELSDFEENIIICANKLYLNTPTGMVVKGTNMEQLTDAIFNNKAALHYLEKLYL